MGGSGVCFLTSLSPGFVYVIAWLLAALVAAFRLCKGAAGRFCVGQFVLLQEQDSFVSGFVTYPPPNPQPVYEWEIQSSGKDSALNWH